MIKVKIAICSKGKDVKDEIDERFGRCQFFQIYDVNDSNKLLEVVENDSYEATSGAGLRAVKVVADRHVEKVIAGNFGPKAEQALDEFNIEPITMKGTVEEALESFDKSSEKRIFVPLLDDSGLDSRISPHFGHAPFFAIITADKQPEILRNEVDHHDLAKSPVQQIKEMANPDVVVAMKMGMRAIKLFAEENIELKEAQGTTLREIIDDLDNLPPLTSSCGH